MGDKRLTVADLSSDQREVFEAMRAWTNGSGPRFDGVQSSLLTVGGLGGVGKSTLVGVFAANTPLLVAYVTFTGRASSILARKLKAAGAAITDKMRPPDGMKMRGGAAEQLYDRALGEHDGPSFVGTIHRLLYRPVIDSKTEELTGWVKREKLDRTYDLIVIDEASMVGGNMLADLQAHGVPILAVGDHGQLPPVMDAGDLMRDPMLRLEKIHRQALGNPIIALAHAIRSTGRFENARVLMTSGDCRVQFRRKADVGHVLLDAYAASPSAPSALDVGILCWMNRTRVGLNATARKALGYAGPPRRGEIVIALKNKPPVYNGMRGYLTADSTPGHEPWIVDLNVEFPDEGLPAQTYEACAPQFCRERLFANVEELKERGMPESFARAGGLWDFGYAMTVHKCVAPETFVETPSGLVFANDLPLTGRIATPTGRAAYRGFVRNGEGRMLKVTTTDGYELKVTIDHGVDVWTPDQRYIRVEAGAMRKGDFVRLRFGAEFDSGPVRLLDGRTPDVRAKLYDLPKRCDEETAEFLGLMVADGTVYRGGFRLAKRHEDVADRFDRLCRRIFGAAPSRFFKLNAYHVEVNSTYIADWLSCLGGLSPNRKRVPWCVLQSPLVVQAAFLRGLFEDGTVNLNSAGRLDHIEFTSCEPMVHQAVRTMLLRWGVVCGATESRPTSLYIYGQYAKKFGDAIGFVSTMKQDRLKVPTAEGTRYVFPLDFEERKVLGREDRIQRHKIQKLDAGLRHRFDDRIGFHHSEVASIEPYVGPSVCVEVPAGHQFLQNGFCGWNSQGSQFEHAIFYVDRPVKPDDEDWRRFAYTAITRASERLTVCL
jgi:intein/homing endonuclease